MEADELISIEEADLGFRVRTIYRSQTFESWGDAFDVALGDVDAMQSEGMVTAREAETLRDALGSLDDEYSE